MDLQMSHYISLGTTFQNHPKSIALNRCTTARYTSAPRKAQMAKVVVEVTYNAEEHIVEQGDSRLVKVTALSFANPLVCKAPGNTFFMLVEGKAQIWFQIAATQVVANLVTTKLTFCHHCTEILALVFVECIQLVHFYTSSFRMSWFLERS